jgi:hypothetical protein
MRKMIIFSVLYLLCLGSMIFVGLYYEALSDGLSANAGGIPLRCRELMSSGGQDDVMIFSFAIFVVPFVLRLLLILRDFTRFEMATYSIALGLVAFALLLASMDCAEIFYTAFFVPDLLLAWAIISAVFSVCLVLIMSRMRGSSREDS